VCSIEQVSFSLGLNTERVSQLTTEGCRQFQAVGAVTNTNAPHQAA